MDLFEAIDRRHSYRGDFKPDPVPREHLHRIVQAGIQAPSGCNKQTTSFVMVDDARMVRRIVNIFDKPFLKTAPALIVCVVDPTPAYGEEHFELEDCSAAVENMLLAITALGYATVWLDGALRGGEGDEIGRLLGVPEGKRAQVLLPLGVPVDSGVQRERKRFEERAWFNSYGG